MNDLIGTAVLVASLFGGTMVAKEIFFEVRSAALTKAAQGLPNLSKLSRSLTTHPKDRRDSNHTLKTKEVKMR